MAAIEAENLDVVAIYEDTFSSLTQKVAAIKLEEINAEEASLQEKYAFMIYTTGTFESAVRCEMENRLFEQIALNLNKGQELPEDTKVLYLTEYLNIICGRALSSINGKLKSASRLTVPKFIKEGEEGQKEAYAHEEHIGFATEYGNMKVVLKYNYETQRRQSNMAKSVLVIDDSPFIAMQVTEGIEGNGYKVVGHARSGEEGVTMYQELTPDVVLLDIIMPGMDGFETAQEILSKTPEAKIVMLSSLCDSETLEEVKNIGLKYLVPKPFAADTLISTLDRILSEAE